MRTLPAMLAAYLCLTGATVQAEVPQTNWTDLIDHSAQEFEDPFLALTPDQISDLRNLVRLRGKKEKAGISADEIEAIDAEITAISDELSKEGVDADWLISQRWVVAERREQAGKAGNPEFDKVQVRLGGFVIPAAQGEDGLQMAYLVPERGMCSHVPPPSPNQMIRLRLNNDWEASTIYEPIVVTGEIRIEPSQRQMLVVDGFVQMKATFTLDVENVETFGPSPGSPNESNDPLERALAKKLKVSVEP